MKKSILLIFILTYVGSNAQSTDSKYDNIKVFVKIDSLYDALASTGYSVRMVGSFTLIVNANTAGVSEVVRFFANPFDTVVYKMVRLIPEQKQINNFNYFDVYRKSVSRQAGVSPYEENLDPSNGEIYSKWVRGSSLVTLIVNYRNQLIYTDESIFSNRMAPMYDQKQAK